MKRRKKSLWMLLAVALVLFTFVARRQLLPQEHCPVEKPSFVERTPSTIVVRVLDETTAQGIADVQVGIREHQYCSECGGENSCWPESAVHVRKYTDASGRVEFETDSLDYYVDPIAVPGHEGYNEIIDLQFVAPGETYDDHVQVEKTGNTLSLTMSFGRAIPD